MKLNVYVDGFNLYYGSLKGTSYRWLNLESYLHQEFPRDTILQIRYFTALVKAKSSKSGQDIRQQTYLRALGTLGTVEIHYGHYLSSKVSMPLANPPAGGPYMAQVLKSEEKGSDVNIATYMLCDAFRGNCEGQVLVSNDSDLQEPVRIVTTELNLPVTILHPLSGNRYPSNVLRKVATRSLTVTRHFLGSSQFPNSLMDAAGRTITKPPQW